MGIQLSGFKMGYQDYQYGWKTCPNSAGGVSVVLNLTNTGTKTIKYAYFTFCPYNAVNDIVSDSISGKSEKLGTCTGPIGPNETKSGILWENLWYNHSIQMVRIKEVTLEYMDGSKETIPSSAIEIVNKKSGGCYVATCVYGSYDCPQVWTLRRYRDNTLASTWYGRAFIKTYYAISPTLVSWFGHTAWFKKLWKNKLDRMIQRLKNEGVADTQYEDQEW